MKIYLNKISGIDDSIVSLHVSKRNIDRYKEFEIRELCNKILDNRGYMKQVFPMTVTKADIGLFNSYMSKLIKYGVDHGHHTLLRFIDVSCTVYGLHRGAQDDFDAHAKRLEGRIVRSSTRLAKFKGGEKSDWYEGKILTTDEVLELLSIRTPDKITDDDGRTYVKTVNGYVLEEYEMNNDVLRGLYNLSIPSNFVFKCNLVDMAHIVSLRDKNGHAAPELQEMIESFIEQIEKATNGYINREVMYDINGATV